jgi:hypothetical protein
VGFGLGIKFIERLQLEMVHHQAQIGELGFRLGVGVSKFQAVRHAMEAFAQSAVLLRVAQLAQQLAGFFRAPAGLFDQPQRGGERDPARFRVLEHAAFEHPALPWPICVEPAGAICAQSRARLRKPGDGRLAARNRDRQPERFQFRRIVARLEFNEIEERTVAAEPACAAELFTSFHRPTIRELVAQ